MLARPSAGRVRIRLSGMRRFIPLRDSLRAPLPSSLDAGRGAVRVTTAGSRHTATFAGGRFGVRQRRRGSAVTSIRLVGGSFRGCTGGRVVRRLRVTARGLFQIAGRRSVTVARRAGLTVLDRCNGTLTRVRRGRAQVLDRGSGRRVSLGAGRAYLARRR